MAKILVVDDDRAVVQLIMDALARGNQTIFASDGQAALHQVVAEHPDLVMLDLKLPDIDGLMLISKIRALSHVPIITLSARNEQSDVVLALQAGADDVIRKPFDLYDLEARVEAVLRRSTAGIIDEDDGIRRVGPLVISRSRVATIDGHPLHLTPLEHKLLRVLATYADQIVSREDLYTGVWGSSDGLTGHTVDIHISRLRKRLATATAVLAIVNFRSRGYMLKSERDTA